MLSFMPDSWLHLAILGSMIAGLIIYTLGLFVRLAPPLIPYKTPLEIIGVLLIVGGVYFYGSYDTEMSWRKRVEEAQAKIAVAEKKSDDANHALSIERKKKQQVITKTEIQIKERIVKDSAKIDATCVVDPLAISDLNAAAKNPNAPGSVNVTVDAGATK